MLKLSQKLVDSTVAESDLIGKHIEFYHKQKSRLFEDPGKYRIGVVRKISRDFLYIRSPGFNYLIRVDRSDIVGQITSKHRRKIDWGV